MLDAAPEAFDEDVVEGSPPSIHADDYAFSFEHIGERHAGELRALVAVEDFGRAVVAQDVLQTVDAEHGFHAVADSPIEYSARVPVDDRHQVGEATRQSDVRDVGAPNLVWPDHGNAAQQVGIDSAALWRNPLFRYAPPGIPPQQRPEQKQQQNQKQRQRQKPNRGSAVQLRVKSNVQLKLTALLS